jgi:hypothetical protein
MTRLRFWLPIPLVAMILALGGCSNSPSLPIFVGLTPSTSQAIDQGQSLAIKATVTNDTSSQGVRWSTSGPGTISPLTGPSTSYISPTGTLAGPQHVTVTATSVADSTKTASIQITVNPYLTVQFPTLFNGTVGVPYSQPIAFNGGTVPFQWSIYNGAIETGTGVGGSVPDGLTLDPATGTVSGIPTAAGTWYFEATVTDADGATVYAPFLSLQINPATAATANAVPFLNQPLVPDSVSPGASGLMLKVSGTGFVSSATINFNGTPLTTTFVDSGHLSAFLPAADIATAKTASVTVVNPAPGGGSSNVVYFQVGALESTVSFGNAPNSPLQIPIPFGLATADFNQDGKPDLAVAGGTRLYVMLSKGDGTFMPALGSPNPIPSPPYDDFASPYLGPITVGDFNNSGHAGLAVGMFQSEAAAILLGNGNGTLSTSSAAFANSPGEPMGAIQAADFNADGNLDLVLINELNGYSLVDLGYGKGAFNAGGELSYPGGPGSGVAVGDFNGDGKLDIAVAGGGVSIWLGNGDGTFTVTGASPIPVGIGLSAIAAGDFNGDGKLDLAVTDESGNAVDVLRGNGDGTFLAPISFSAGHEPGAIVVGDFNNDGKLDLAIANYGDNTVTLLLGNGDATFTPASGSPYPVGKAPSSIVAADFNGDGKLDLAVGSGLDGTGTVSILLQQ